ncbi:MAG TPA: hypothetical protein VFB20_17205 [Burkholderiales bacterium]|nr:hypothetical protein [Burkholderiales bacterium]
MQPASPKSGYTFTVERLKILLILLISFWLPMQGASAVVMPYCKHDQSGSARTSVSAHHTAAGHGAVGHVGHEDGDHSTGHNSVPAAALSPCDGCGHCHLACAFTLPSRSLAASEFISFAAPSFTPQLPHGITPHPLHRPPLLARA